jgi:hypothetical protein
MKIMSFTYTKANGNKSFRTVAALSEPSENVFGIDITELEDERQGQFLYELEMLVEKRKMEMEKLMADFDIKSNYRSFKPSGMSDIHVDV